MAFTPEQIAAYVTSEGAACPYCASKEIESDRLQADGDSACAVVQCDGCGKSWLDVFTLTTIEERD